VAAFAQHVQIGNAGNAAVAAAAGEQVGQAGEGDAAAAAGDHEVSKRIDQIAGAGWRQRAVIGKLFEVMDDDAGADLADVDAVDEVDAPEHDGDETGAVGG